MSGRHFQQITMACGEAAWREERETKVARVFCAAQVTRLASYRRHWDLRMGERNGDERRKRSRRVVRAREKGDKVGHTSFKLLSFSPNHFLILASPSSALARALSLSFPSQALTSSILPLPLAPRPCELRIGVGDHLLHVLLPGVLWIPSSLWGRSPFKVSN